MCGTLPVHELDGSHQVIAVRPSPVSEYGGDAEAVVHVVVVVVSE